MSELPSSVREAAAAGDALALARTLIATPSVNPVLEAGGDGERAVAELTAGWLRAWGLETELIEVAAGRYNVVARLEGSGPTVLFNGHLDTVGVSGMSIPPHDPRLEDGLLWGRGSCDMKGGIASLLAATARLAEDGDRPSVVVALTADEEHASVGMTAFVESGVDADMAVVCEPTRLAVMPAHKGFVWVEARFEGRAAHGSRPDLGVDAIRHAALYMAALEAYGADLSARAPHPLLQRGSFHAGTIRGGSAGSVYPDACELLLERRTMPGEDPAAVVAEFQAVLDELGAREPDLSATLTMPLERPGTEVAESSPLVQGLLQAGEKHGVLPKVEGMTAWVDAALLNVAGIPAVCYGPGDIAQAHTENEWIEAAQIETCANVLETFARSLVD